MPQHLEECKGGDVNGFRVVNEVGVLISTTVSAQKARSKLQIHIMRSYDQLIWGTYRTRSSSARAAHARCSGHHSIEPVHGMYLYRSEGWMAREDNNRRP